MLDRQKGNIVFECDDCNEVLETNTSDFSSALDVLRRNGWKAKKNERTDQWEHACDRCS